MDATELLRRQHREVDELIEAVLAARGDARLALLGETIAALREHMTIEEELLYPYLAHRPAVADLVADGYSDHDEAEELIADLERAAYGESPELGELVLRLQELVREHIDPEEAILFPLLVRELGRADLARLGRDMLRRLAELEEADELRP